MSLKHLGIAIKSLHPGAYDSHDDEAVGLAMTKRFPGLYDHHLDGSESQGQKQVEKRGIDSGFRKGISAMDRDTAPETPKTLKIQLDQLSQGMRRCVFVARGSKVQITAADYGARKLPTPAGDFYYAPGRITAKQILTALRDHSLSDILGDAKKGYGAPDKEKLQPPVEAVVARDADGETANSALTDPQHEESAVDAAAGVTPKGGSISVEPPQKELSHREQPAESPEDVDMPDPSPMAKPLKVKRPGGRGGRWPKP